ncbi:PAP2 superfamily protein [Serinibacter salmoneus]|uniref:PAP2 superfamily protein n=2 Tax=Serinibacter salmoneus TaxID=556530 RepID=A0A2A9D1V6_9MICO|nr:PAP2 superfamily protein [Serinibacter salmoneus]
MAVVVGLAAVFVNTTPGQWVEQVALRGSELGRESVQPLTRFVLGLVSVPFLLAGAAACAAVALVRRRWGDAIRVAVIVGGANLTTQVLKDVIERPALLEEWKGMASYPSGHTTVAASLAAVALLVAPRVARPAVALVGAGYMIATGVATVSLAWHRPSDVVGAFAVVTAWSLLAMIPTRGARADGEPGTAGRVVVGWLLGALAVAGLAIGAVAAFVAANAAAGAPADASATTYYLAYLSSSLGIVGAGCLAQWALLLARR